jgi:hypothetical protein
MTPSCGLDEAGLRLQFERYSEVGTRAQVVDRRRGRLVVDLDEHVEPRLVDQLLAVERECCPFLELDWRPQARRLTISVLRAEHEPVLDAIAYALGLDGSVPATASD